MLRNINVKRENSNLHDLNLENITVNISIVTYYTLCSFRLNALLKEW